MKQISNSFFWNKPAIISMHRLNFMGSLSEENRTINLSGLNTLLHQIFKQWPDVIFLSSDQLGEFIASEF